MASNLFFGLILFLLVLVEASFVQGRVEFLDFRQCYDEKITSDIATPGSNLICSRLDGSPILDPRSRPYPTLEGCLALCGHGYRLWPAKETGLRVLYFIVPIVILSVRYAFAPIGITNKAWTLIHLVGDPIDSLWSTLIRQEKARRNYHLAMEIAPGAPREVAAIWTAYDSWWQDPAGVTRKELCRRSPSQANGQNAATGRNQLPDLLTRREICHIKKCALQLAKNRTTNLLISWIAIIIFLGSLTGAYIRTATTKKVNQTPHTLAIVILFSFLVFAVYISGHVGNFKRVTEVIDELDELHEHCPNLFPKVHGFAIPKSGTRLNSFKLRFENAATYAGLNHSWRPNKSLERFNHSDRSTWLLFACSFLVVTTAWVFAFTLSYRTPRSGLGCRSVTWMCIYIAWLLSATFDFARSFFPPTDAKAARRWWMWGSIPKDTFITVSIMTMVGIVQAGYFNNCRCMASNFGGRSDPRSICIDLGPVTEEQLVRNWMMWLAFPIGGLIGILLLIFVTGYEGEGGRMLFHRTDSELRSEEYALRAMQTRLDMLPKVPDPVTGDSDDEGDTPARGDGRRGELDSYMLLAISTR